MKASGSSLVVSELVSELPWRCDDLAVVVTHPYGQYSPITRAEYMTGHLSLETDADPDSEPFRDLLGKVAELLDDLSPKGSKLTVAIRERITALANEIEEAL
jgi:hypothetical protein